MQPPWLTDTGITRHAGLPLLPRSLGVVAFRAIRTLRILNAKGLWIKLHNGDIHLPAGCFPGLALGDSWPSLSRECELSHMIPNFYHGRELCAGLIPASQRRGAGKCGEAAVWPCGTSPSLFSKCPISMASLNQRGLEAMTSSSLSTIHHQLNERKLQIHVEGNR